MSGYIAGVDRLQTVLFPESLDEYVGGESAVRVIDAFVDSLSMDTLGFTRAQPADRGAPGYDPRALLKLYLYGYLNRTRSSRRLERETYRNVEVMWLLGRLTPDHKTIADFRSAHAKALPQVFREFTVVCRRLELFSAELIGIDGSKLRAVNAKDRSFTAAELERLLTRIDARITEYLTLLETTDAAEASATEPREASGLADKLAHLETRQTEYRTLLQQLEEAGDTQVTLTDPESRRMKVGAGTQVCYNGQIAVDEQHHLIVAQDVTNEVTDQHQLHPMAEAAKAALGVATLAVTADAGYHTGDEVAACLTQGITPTVPAPPAKPEQAGTFPKTAFTYLVAQDAYRCPGEAVLPYRFTDKEGDRFYYDYAACAACPLRARCTQTKDPTHGRRIKRVQHEDLLEAMAARLRAAPELRVRRKSLVEHPFGTLKRWDDAGYFLLRGLAKVRGEFSLMTLAYNLRRAMGVVGVPRLLAALRPAPMAHA